MRPNDHFSHEISPDRFSMDPRAAEALLQCRAAGGRALRCGVSGGFCRRVVGLISLKTEPFLELRDSNSTEMYGSPMGFQTVSGGDPGHARSCSRPPERPEKEGILGVLFFFGARLGGDKGSRQGNRHREGQPPITNHQ